MKRLLFLIVLFAGIASAQGTSKGGSILKIPATPFEASTGQSFVADEHQVESVLLNPANIVALSSYTIDFSHNSWIEDVGSEYLSIAGPLSIGSISIAIKSSSVDGIEIRTIPGPSEGTFSYKNACFQVTYGLSVSDNFSLGISPKYLYEKIYIDETNGFGLDAGILYHSHIDGLTLGASITNIGKMSAYYSEQIDLPSALHIGGTYSMPMNNWDIRLACAYSPELGLAIHHFNFGAECAFNRIIALRAGYQTGFENHGFCFGMGITYKPLVISYAFVPFSFQMGNAQTISAAIQF